MSFTFDRLAYIDRLTAAGFEDRQARAHADALDAALHESVASKGDVHDLGQDLRKELSKLDQDLRKDIDGVRREVEDVRKELGQVEKRLETKLESKIETTAAILKVEILRWLIITQIALLGLAFAGAKFLK